MMSSIFDTTKALSVLVLLACGIGACGKSRRDPGSEGAQSGTGGALGCDPDVVANEANNYSIESWLSFPPVSVKPASDLSFDWSGVTRDMLGRAVDPLADLDHATIVMWSLKLEELEPALNSDRLEAGDPTTVPLTLYTDNEVTSGNLLSFTLAGNPVLREEVMPFFDAAKYPPDQHIYTIMVASGDTVGQGTRMIQSFKLDPASTNTTVTLTSTSTKLEYSVDLRSLMPAQVPAATAAIHVDWSDLKVNGLGEPAFPGSISRVLLGRYSETVAELEARFLELDLIAQDLYQADVPSGTTVDLSALVTAGGQPFAGIDANSTWVLALICGDCSNPAPWYLTLLEPCH